MVCTFMINEALISKIILLLSSLIPISSVQVAAQNYLHSNFDYGLEAWYQALCLMSWRSHFSADAL